MERVYRFAGHTCAVSLCRRDELYSDRAPVAFSVGDTNTARYLPDAGARFVLPSGEAAKSWQELERLLAAMLDAGLTRDSVVYGVGGGVVCDISALASSLYMRGCALVLVPTTLLAMVDAAVGGKTGVNFGGYKNMVGTFYPAQAVRLCPELLHTLPEREYRSGLAEVIKTALLGDGSLLDDLEQRREAVLSRDDGLLADVVWRCVQVKAGLVEVDLTEQGVRAHLNLGHTFAHALESVEGLGLWSHGEAVAWGLARAMELGVAAGITEAGYAARVRAILDAYGYRLDPIPEAASAIRAAMDRDKKRRAGEVRFVLQEQLGRTVVTAVADRLVERTLAGR